MSTVSVSPASAQLGERNIPGSSWSSSANGRGQGLSPALSCDVVSTNRERSKR